MVPKIRQVGLAWPDLVSSQPAGYNVPAPILTAGHSNKLQRQGQAKTQTLCLGGWTLSEKKLEYLSEVQMETKLTHTLSNDQIGTKMVNTIDTVGMGNNNFHKTRSNLPDLL